MKIIQSTNADESKKYILTIKRGEEVFTELLKFIKEENINCATFNGLGATDKIEIAYYNLQTKEYEKQIIEEELELLNINGNLAWILDQEIKTYKPVLHIHGVFGKRNLETLGGHLFSLRISGACEIHLTSYPKKILREFDEETGLNLICKIL